MDRKITGTRIRRAGERIKEGIYGKYKETLKKAGLFFSDVRALGPVDEFIKDILKEIDENHEKSSWVDITVLITNILGFAAYCVISPVLAEYQREMGIRIFSFIAIGVIVAVIIWELICLIGRKYLKVIGKIFYRFGEEVALFCNKYFRPIAVVIELLYFIFIICIVWLAGIVEKVIIVMGNIVTGFFKWYPNGIKWIPIFGAVVFLMFRLLMSETACYSSVVEVYGIPTGLGEKLEKKEREKCAAYWEIKDNTFFNVMTLTYKEPYNQLEVMKENSTAYNMLFFQPVTRIEIKYDEDKSQYLSLNQSSFEVAKENGYKEPVKISYYNSSNKLVLKLERNEYGKFDIIRYSSADMPQLLNSTLLYTQNEEVSENSLTSRQIEVTYNAEGLPETRRLSPYMYNANGINGEYYVYDENKRLTTLYYLDINGEFVCNKQGIMMIDFQYEDNGNLHSIRYYGGEDRTKKTEGYQGVFCERFSYDSNGNLKERSQRDRNENLRSDNNGVCMYRYEYDEKADYELRKEEFLGFDGEPVRDNCFQSTYVVFEMSDKGTDRELSVSIDAIGSSVTDVSHPVPEAADGQMYSPPVLEAEISSPANVGEYQAASGPDYIRQVVEAISLNTESSQIQGSFGADGMQQEKQTTLFAYSTKKNQGSFESDDIWRTEFFSNGKNKNRQSDQMEGVSQYNKQEDQAKSSENKESGGIYPDEEADIIRSYESVYYRIDPDGRILEKRYCNKGGRTVTHKDGYAAVRYTYDKQGRITYKRYYDKSEKPCCINGGYAVVENTYVSDQNDDIESVKYLNDDSKTLALNTELGYAYVEYTWIAQDKNEIVYKQYFDEKGEAVCLPGLGYAMTEQFYDERNFLIWEAYYDKKDEKYKKICRADYGVAEIWYEYEDSGNCIRELYKDENGQLVNRSDTGYAAVYWKYEDGKMVDCHYEGNRNQMLKAAVDRTTGIAGIRYIYESGKTVREEYYDVEGQPSFRTDIGCAVQGFEYNDRGEVCTKFYCGLEGELVLRKDTGYAVEAYQDDEYGQRISVRYYDTKKQPVISAEDHCAGYDYEYDKEGNREYIKYIGLDGELMVRRDLGYAQVHFSYDSDGNIKEGEYFDKDKDENGDYILTARKERGYARYTNKYDENGNWKESCYFGTDGAPVLRQDEGYFSIENEYDNEGRLISQKFYDIYDVDAVDDSEEKPLIISTKYCCAGFLYEYDDEFDNESDNIFGFTYEKNEKGVRKTTTYIGLNEEPVIRRDLGYAMVKSVYDLEDHEVSAVFCDEAGNVTFRKEGGYAAFRNKYENGKWVEGKYYGADGKPILRNDTGYASIVNEYDEYGQRIKESYYNEYGELTISTKYHCACFKYQYDEAGNKTHVRYLDTKGKIMVLRDLGYAQVEIGYDSVGNKVSESYFDTKGKPAVWKEGGYASYVSEYENGKWMESRYYDKKGRPTKRNDEGYAVLKNTYDEYGQRITQSYYDAADQLKPVISTEHHCAGFQFEYDEKGNIVYVGYLGLDGNLMVRRDLGYAQMIMEYDEEGIGNKEREAYFDILGNPAVDKEGGYSYYKNDYDEKGRLKKIEYYIIQNVRKKVDMAYDKAESSVENGRDGIDKVKEEGELVLRKDTGYAKVEYEYDEWGQETGCFYSGADTKPVISTKYLCAGFEYGYDERGNETDIYYLGLDKEKIVRRDLGISHIRKEYDLQDNLIKKSYFDLNGPAVYNKKGYEVYEEVFVNGQVVEKRYLDTDGNLVMHGDEGYAIVRYKYDEYGQCISEFYYDSNCKSIISGKYYCAGIEYEYDELGNKTDRRYLGLDGDSIIRRDLGYAHISLGYDECGNEIEASYYDEYENPVIWKEGGNASCEFIYENGNCVERRYFDKEGNLKLRWDTGYAIIRYEYDEYGQCIGEDYYDTEVKPVFKSDYQCAGCQFGYDEKGNQTETRYIGLDGKPMMWKDLGYAQIRWEFDHFNNQINKIYLDEEGQPVVWETLGYAQTKWEYDNLGRISKESYYDAAGEPVVSKESGYAYCQFSYGEEERWEEIQYFDLEGKLIKRNDKGYSIIVYDYDEFGQKTGEHYWYYDTKWIRAFNTENNCTGISYYYEENGDNTYIWYKGEGGEAAERKDIGIAEEFMEYDVYGHVITKEYHMADPGDGGKEILGIHKDLGYAKVEYKYENNAQTETRYYGADNGLIIPKGKGYAIYSREYDELGQLKKEAYYDEEGYPVNYIDGKYAMVEYGYDTNGYIKDRDYKHKGEVERYPL